MPRAQLSADNFMFIKLFDEHRSIIRVVEEILRVMQALSDPTRLAVFNCIRRCGGQTVYDTQTGECDATEPGAVAVCDVKCQVPCTPSTLTHHLNILRESGIIETERKGRKAYVKLCRQRLEQVAAFLLEIK